MSDFLFSIKIELEAGDLSMHLNVESWETKLKANHAASFILNSESELTASASAHKIPTPKEQSECAELIRSLATSLISRFFELYSERDCDRAIWLLERLTKRMHDHIHCLIWKSILGHAYWARGYSKLVWSSSERARLDSLEAFKQSFATQTEAIFDSLQHSDSFFESEALGFYIPNMFSHLSVCLDWFQLNHLKQTGGPNNEQYLGQYLDVERLFRIVGMRINDFTKPETYIKWCSIELRKMAVDFTPPDDLSSYIRRLVSYAPSIRKDDIFANLKVVDDLKKAQKRQSESHPQWAELTAAIGYRLDLRLNNKRAAIPYYLAAFNSLPSHLEDRIGTGFRLFKTLRNYPEVRDWPLACEVATKVIQLVPQEIARRADHVNRQRFSRNLNQQGISELICESVYIGIRTKGFGPIWALKQLEKGRGHVAAAIYELRTKIIDLPGSLAPETVLEFENLQNTLTSMNAETSDRHRARVRFDELCGEIRKTPGYQNFPIDLDTCDILAAAKYGPVVVINVPEAPDGVCDAILIPCEEEDQIRHLELKDLYPEDIWLRQPGLGDTESLLDILSWLWEFLAQPILDALGFCQAQPEHTESWPRIWWIPTGPLAQFPIHAAGNYFQQSRETVLDRVMSSYSPSLKALIQARRVRSGDLGPEDGHRNPSASQRRGEALVISMPTTSGASYLTNADSEKEMVRNLCHKMQLEPSPKGIEPTKEAILSYLRDHNCEVFHFAGHGLTDPNDPVQSALLLKDGVRTAPSTRKLKAESLAQHKRLTSPSYSLASHCFFSS